MVNQVWILAQLHKLTPIFVEIFQAYKFDLYIAIYGNYLYMSVYVYMYIKWNCVSSK